MKRDTKIAVFIVGLLAVAMLVANVPNFEFPEITFNLPATQSDNEGSTTIINEGDTYVSEPSSDSIAPTSLMISFDDTSITMGDTLWGTVVSDGKDYPITVHAYLVGADLEQTYGGLLGDGGKFYDSNVMDVPGYYDFWATTDTVTSNTPRVTVEGVLVVSSHTHYSHTFDTTITLDLYSHTSGTAQVIAVDPVHFTMTPLGNTVINTKGYGEIAPDFGVLPTGNYEITCLINGLDSADYGDNPWVEVGR